MKACRAACLMFVCFAAASGVAAAATCAAHSGPRRAVLLELYTSEGCDSCPPADRRLSHFGSRPDHAERVVPLAFHVDYWDRLGWTDRYASPRHTQRQYEMAGRAGSRLVYTPQFLRNGRDWRAAGSPLDGAAEPPSRIAMALELGAPEGGQLPVRGEISGMTAGAEAWLALYENKLESQVRRGENAGKTLHHDYVVRRLIGPLAPDSQGHMSLRQEIALEADWKRADLGLAAFVQDKASGEILQALQRPVCAVQPRG